MVSIQAIWLFFCFCFQLNKRKEKWDVNFNFAIETEFIHEFNNSKKQRKSPLLHALYHLLSMILSVCSWEGFSLRKKNNTYLSKSWYYLLEIIVKIMGIAVPFFRQQFIENAEIVRIQIHRNKNKWYHNQTYLNMFEIIIRQMSHICMQMCVLYWLHITWPSFDMYIWTQLDNTMKSSK